MADAPPHMLAPLELTAAALRTVQPRQFYSKFLARSVRPDGRSLLHARRAVVTAGTITSAIGSAMVRIGQTVALAGVQCEPATPAEAEPNCGRLLVTLDVAKTCAAASASSSRTGGGAMRFEREQAASLALLQRTLGEMVDAQALAIEAGRAVWVCRCDVHILEHDGAIVDAALLAAMCALRASSESRTCDLLLPRGQLAG
jgi:exosome complex component RRP43